MSELNNAFVIFTRGRGRGGPEAFWTGDITEAGWPARSADLEDALQFATAREAYDAATANLTRAPDLNEFLVGRRPERLHARPPTHARAA